MGPNWIEKFLSFDELIGLGLTKATYLIGLVIIVGWAVVRMFVALGSLFDRFFFAVGTFIAAPLQGLLAILVWRLIAEITFIYFRDHGKAVSEPQKETSKPYTDGFTIDAEETHSTEA